MFKKTVQRSSLIGILISIIITTLFFWEFGFADLPQQVFFQARLSKKDKTTLSGSHSFTFRLYSASSGGSSLWTETQTVTADSSGIISCYLGSAAAFPSSLDFNSTYYLSIEVGSDGEMSPRIKVVPSLAALNADRYDALNSTQFLRSDTSDTMEGSLTFSAVGSDIITGTNEHLTLMPNGSGNVGIGTSSPTQKLEVSGTVKATAFEGDGSSLTGVSAGWTRSGTNIYPTTITDNIGIGTTAPVAILQVGTSPNAPLAVLAGGNVGIGTTNPTAALHISNSGQLKINDYTLPTGTGATNQILKLTNATTLDWAADSSGTGTASTEGTVDGVMYLKAANTGAGASLTLWDNAQGQLNVGSGTTGNSSTLYVRGAGTAATFALRIANSTPSDRLVVLDNGNVGIGLTNPSQQLELSGDLKITGDDLFMNTNTSGAVLVADGTNFNPVVMSGDVAIGTDGTATIQDNAVDGTDVSLASEAGGDIMYSDGTNWVRLAKGTAGQVLEMNSGATAPEWDADDSGTGTASTEGTVDGVMYLKAANTGAGASLTLWDNAQGQLNVGSGTTGNSSTLYIRGAGTAATFALRIANSTPTDRLVVLDNGNVGIGLTVPYGLLQVGTAPTNPGLIVTTGNNVGIGTTAPTRALFVQGGDIRTTNDSYVDNNLNVDKLYIGWDGSPPDSLISTYNTNEALYINPNGTGVIVMQPDSAANVGIGITSPLALLHLRAAGSGTNFALRIADSTPTDRLVVLDNGNVGIATTSPSYSLHVAGTAAAQTLRFGTLYDNLLPAGTGANNQILKTNASGTITWQDDSTGTGTASTEGTVNGVLYLKAANTGAGASLTLWDNAQGQLNVGSGTTGNSSTLYIRGAGTAATFALRIANSTPTDRLVVLDNGNVGIGRTNPQALLDALAGSGTQLRLSYDATNYVNFVVSNNSSMTITTADSTAPVRFERAISVNTADSPPSNVGLYTKNARLQAGTAPNPALFVDSPAGRVAIGHTSPVGLLQVGTSPAPGLLVTAGGNVGIGTTNPAAKLQVVASNTAPANNLYIQGAAGGRLIISQPDGGCSSCGVDAAGTTWSCIDVTCP